MKNNSRNSYLFKNTAIFTIGNLATKVIAFFLVPLYTNVLTTSEYGTVDIITTVSIIAIPILTFNIMESVMRFNLDDDVDQNKITKIGIIVLLGGIVVGLLIIPICNLWDKINDYSTLIYFYIIFSASSQIFLCDLRGKELLVLYTIGNILNTFLIGAFNIIFLLVFKRGIAGYLLAYILASAIVTIYALIVGKGYKAIRTTIDTNKMKEMLKYSVVLIPNSFMWWIMNSSDHIMVTSMIGIAANGIYAISYKLPTLIQTFTGIFNQAWSYSAIKENDAEDIESYTNKVFKSMIGIIMLIGICMMTFIKPFLYIYVSNDYYVAWKYTPFLIVGFVYLTLASFMSTSYTVNKDSKGFLISGTLGAIVNIVLNFILIPIIGIYGAAFSTCLSYISVLVFRIFHTKKYINYNILTKEFSIGTVALLLSGLLMYFNSVYCQIIQVSILIIVLIMFRSTWMPLVSTIFKRNRSIINN